MKTLRKRIDQIDNKILRLLNERAKVTLEIGRFKSKGKAPSFSPDREAHIYKRLLESNRSGLLKKETIKAIYREIMSGSLAIQSPPKVAYMGPEATFTHIAAVKKFGESLEYIKCDGIADVFMEVERDRADYGVVPIENSTEGAVNHTLDMFIDSELKICSEMYLPIAHYLMNMTGALKDIKTIYSHQQVLAQCRIWLEKNLPKVELVPVASTTLAAGYARYLNADPNSKNYPKYSAAIASKLAAEKYGLKIVAKSIEDSSHNITRFLIIGKQETEPTGNDKTSIVFSMKDKAGALHDVLTPFKKRKVNLTKIESRPSKKKAWKYYFYVDMQGHIKEKKVAQSIKLLEKHCTYFRVLGSYPASQ